MDRRSMLGRLIATVVGMFGVSQTKVATEYRVTGGLPLPGTPYPSPPVDTTSMHNVQWRTCEPAADQLLNAVKITEVDLLEIIHDGGPHDGYPTYVKIDGKMLGGPNGINPRPKWEKQISLRALVDQPLEVRVDYADGSAELFYPKQFDFTLEDIRIQIHPDRRPCKIWIGGYQPRVRCLQIKFAVGEVVWVDVQLLPGVGHSQE